MAVAAAIVMLVGVCMVGVTGIFALLSVGNLRMARRLRRTPPTPIGSWRDGPVAAEAMTEFGAAGRQIAPLSGAECAWFHTTATCYRSGDSDGDLTWRADVGRTPAHPALADGTARVPVDPRVLSGHGPAATESTSKEYVHKRDGVPPAWVPAEMARRIRHGDRVVVSEVRLPRGRPVYALARFDNGVLTRRGRTVFTPGRWADVITATESDLRLMTVTMPIFVVVGLIVAGAGLAALLAVTG
jgi:hypothetical protein